MNSYSIREVIEMAIRTERLGFEYYTELAQRFKEEKEFYDLFSFLAQNELVHERKFSKLIEETEGEELEGWHEVSEYLRAYVESAFFLGKDKSLVHMLSAQNVIAAIGLAIGFEKETLLYFYTLRDGIEKKDIVDKIIKEEKDHIKRLAQYKGRIMKKG